jgi:hypothetical protein
MTITAAPTRERLGELVAYFLRLGLLGFGGPVALVQALLFGGDTVMLGAVTVPPLSESPTREEPY